MLAGTLLTVGLVAVAKYASARVATFFVSFLAVQCVLNALLDLKTVFFLSSPFAPSVPTDAVNMANATGHSGDLLGRDLDCLVAGNSVGGDAGLRGGSQAKDSSGYDPRRSARCALAFRSCRQFNPRKPE